MEESINASLFRATPWYEEHYNNLTEGIVRSIEDPSYKHNCILAVFGEKAFPVWLNKHRDARIAAAEFKLVSVSEFCLYRL